MGSPPSRRWRSTSSWSPSRKDSGPQALPLPVPSSDIGHQQGSGRSTHWKDRSRALSRGLSWVSRRYRPF